MSWADGLQVAGYRAGWGLVKRLPERIAYRAFDQVADRMTARNGKSVQRLRANYARVRPELTPAQLEELVRAGVRSYLRYWCDAFRLSVIDPEDLDAGFELRNRDLPQRIVDQGEPLVLFLGHMGNWDYCGAWATTHFAKVTTVAERLKPEQVFQEFLDFRESLGMRIIPLTGRVSPFPELREALTGGAFVPLLADRDLSGSGITVRLGGHELSVAAGPARLAIETGAALYPLAVYYEPWPGHVRHRTIAEFGPRILVPDRGSDQEKTVAMTQQCFDFIGEKIVEHTQDWHMMQRLFLADT